MTDIIIHISIFFVIIFLYIHLLQQFKLSDEMEIYESDYINKDVFHETCLLKQPFLLNYQSVNPYFFHKLATERKKLSKCAEPIMIKDIADYYPIRQINAATENDEGNADTDAEIKVEEGHKISVDAMSLSYSKALDLLLTKVGVFTEGNEEFIRETEYHNICQDGFDEYLKPIMTINSSYDMIMGANGTTTPLRYHTNDIHCICLTRGKASVKMTPYRNAKYLYPQTDYEHYEFLSVVNPWQPDEKYLKEMEKVKFLDFEIHSGYLLYIPAYWWYSIRFDSVGDSENDVDSEGLTEFVSVKYNPLMNTIANLPSLMIHYLQKQNIHNIYKVMKQ